MLGQRAKFFELLDEFKKLLATQERLPLLETENSKLKADVKYEQDRYRKLSADCSGFLED